MGKIAALFGIFWAWLLGLKIGVAGLWLLFLYALFGSFVVLSFSAFQLQLAIGSYRATNSTPLALWEIANLYSRWKVDADQLAAAANRYKALNESIQDSEGKYQDLLKDQSATYADCRAEILYFISNMQNQIGKIDDEYANILRHNIENSNFCKRDYGTTFLATYKRTIDAKQEIRDRGRNAGKSAPSGVDPAILRVLTDERTQSLNAIIFAKVTQATDIYKTIVYSRAQIEAWQVQKRKTLEEIDRLHVNLANILRTEKGGSLDSGIGDYLTTLSYFDSVTTLPILGDIAPNFSKMPPDTLTLILVLSMGALGGTIQLSRKHLRAMDTTSEETIQTSYYLFRPFLGAITALSVFILVKAGVLVASIPSQGGETANLSPFFISFLGIVSGLLAEQALETIERVGERFFDKSEAKAPDRWAYGLLTAMRTGEDKEAVYKKNLTELARLLGKSEDQVAKWAKEEEAVPEACQRLIAAFFHVPQRQLFSDLRG